MGFGLNLFWGKGTKEDSNMESMDKGTVDPFAKFDDLAMEDVRTRTTKASKFAITPELIAFLTSQANKHNGKVSFLTSTVKEMVKYTGKATEENFFYGLMEKMKPTALKVGMRGKNGNNIERIVFILK